MKLNREWHLVHPMPENPTRDQRIAWHQEHHKHYSCLEIPKSMLDEIKKRKK